jgi:N6-L-threonylcarbamoyladenine synthase
VVGFDPGAELQETLSRDPRYARDRGTRPQHTPVDKPARRVLAVETSCDETAAAVIADGPKLLSNVIRSQDALHAPYGGVVPELAARAHLQTLLPVIERAMETCSSTWDELAAVAVTRGPGLIGCLLVGVNMAQALAWARGLPVIGVSHLAAHIFAAQFEEPALRPPVLGLVVSGGHSDLIRWRADGSIEVIGRTRDDAAGEAFDKGARILGLPFPGGPAIDRLAQEGDPRAFKFPRPRAPGLDFSFSGVKTALLYEVRKHGELSDQMRADLAASYQEAIVDALLQRLETALGAEGPARAHVATVVLGGGVARNRRLREAAAQRIGRLARLIIPAPELCTDNAAMIGAAALLEWDRRGTDPRPFDADPSLGFG